MDNKPQSFLYQWAYVVGFWFGRVIGGYFIQVWEALHHKEPYLIILLIAAYAFYLFVIVGLMWK